MKKEYSVNVSMIAYDKFTLLNSWSNNMEARKL